MAFMCVGLSEFITYFIVGISHFGGERGTRVNFIRAASLDIPGTGEWNLCHSDEVFPESTWTLL